MIERSGEWIRLFRQRQGYTQEMLAAELKVKRQTIMMWEKAPKLNRIVFLALSAIEENQKFRNVMKDGNALLEGVDKGGDSGLIARGE